MRAGVLLAVAAGGFLAAAFGISSSYCQTPSPDAARIRGIRRTLLLTKFYDTPDPLPSGKPGELIRSEDFDDYDLPLAVLAVRILYHSRSAGGQDVAVSGVVLYPDGKPPAGGWPVLAWAHSLDGVSRKCASSLVRNLQHGAALSMYVNLGYAVVATDYAGLGTDFRNAFLDTQSNANDVIYSVQAARRALPQLGSRWIAIGVREGGPAVIGVAELERDIHDANYLGSIAVSGLEDLEDRYEHSGEVTFYPRPLLLTYGVASVYPEFAPKDILTEKALELYPRIQQSCHEPGREELSPAKMLKPNWADNKFVRQYLSRNALGQKPAQGPVLVISSELDPDTPIGGTAQIVAGMCRLGDQVQFERYRQSDVGSVFGDSVPDQISWIQARFSGRPAPSNCSAR